MASAGGPPVDETEGAEGGAARGAIRGLTRMVKSTSKAQVGSMPHGARGVAKGASGIVPKVNAKAVASNLGKLNTLSDVIQVLPKDQESTAHRESRSAKHGNEIKNSNPKYSKGATCASTASSVEMC